MNGSAIERKRVTAMAKSKNTSMSVRVIVGLYRQFEQVARDSDISLAQYRMMLFLRNGPKRAGAIAAAGAVKKPTVSAMLGTLREKGWIADTPDPTDGRVVAVSLTNAGRARMEAFETALANSIAKVAPRTDLTRVHAALGELYAGMAASQDQRLRDIEDKLLG